MKKAPLLFALLFFLFGFTSSFVLADITLDDFNTGSHSLTTAPFTVNGAQYDSENAMPGSVGDIRLIQHAPQGSSTISSLTSEIANGDLKITYSDLTFVGFGCIHGLYGGLISLPASGPGEIEDNDLLPMSNLLDLSGENEITLDYTFNGLANSGVVTIYAFGSPIDGNVFDQTGLIFLQPGTNQLTVDLSTLFTNVDPSQIGGIGINFVAVGVGDVTFHHFAAVGGVANPPTGADSLQVERGTLVAGSVGDTQDSDDVAVRFERQTGLSRLNPVSVVFDGQLPTDNPPSLSIQVESLASLRGVDQVILMFNWNLNDYEQIDLRGTDTFDQTAVVPITGNFLRFVQPGTGNVRTRLGWRPNVRALIRRQPWTVDVDQLLWLTD